MFFDFILNLFALYRIHRTASKGSNRTSNNSSNHKTYESQSEAWSDNIEDNYITGNGPAVQLPEVSIDEEEEKYSAILNVTPCKISIFFKFNVGFFSDVWQQHLQR